MRTVHSSYSPERVNACVRVLAVAQAFSALIKSAQGSFPGRSADQFSRDVSPRVLLKRANLCVCVCVCVCVFHHDRQVELIVGT